MVGAALIEIISLGAGVQSSALALMAAKGLVSPMPAAAIFADTQHEPRIVYRWLDWLERQLPFPVYRVTQGSLAAKELQVRRSKKSGLLYRSAQIPAYTLSDQKKGMMPRHCTRDFKIIPVLRKAKELAGVPRRKRVGIYVRQWIGISTDEIIRIKPSRESWVENRWPLIERGLSRQGCLAWMKDNHFPTPPRSACIFCPYHSDVEWLRLKLESPLEFAGAVQFERDMQVASAKVKTATSTPFLHDSRLPLDQVQFNPAKAKDGFGNECEGMCGS